MLRAALRRAALRRAALRRAALRRDAAFRSGVPAVRSGVPAVRRPGKGREQDAVSFTHRLSEHFISLIFKRWGIRSSPKSAYSWCALRRHEPTDSGSTEDFRLKHCFD